MLIAGLAHEELRISPERPGGLVYTLMDRHDFVIDPLPNLLFTRDSSLWIGDRVGVTSLAMPARRRETTLTDAIYRHHPRFAGTEFVYRPDLEHLEGGDVLLLAPGVLAVGVGERTTPAGAERLARQVFAAGLAHTILVVPIAQERATMHLDTVCTMVDVDAVLMYPNVASTPVGVHGDRRRRTASPRVDGPAPFLRAAADAMDLDQLRVIDTGLDPVTAEREQWDDGNNTLALAPRLCVGYERNVETNAQLERAGIEVIPIAGSELGSGRGGPRCMSCPMVREPLAAIAHRTGPCLSRRARVGRRRQRRVSWRPSRPCRARRPAASSGSVTVERLGVPLGELRDRLLPVGGRACSSGRSQTGTSRPCARNMPANLRPLAERQRARRRRAGPARPARRPRRPAAPSARAPSPAPGTSTRPARRPAARSGRWRRWPAPATPGRSGRRSRPGRARTRTRRAW